MPPPPKPRKGLYGDKDFNLDDEVRVSFTGKIVALDAADSCMKVMTRTGLVHYVFDGDPSVIILPVKASWPPKTHDVWLFGGKVWWCTNPDFMYSVNRDGGLAYPRKAESLLHSTDNPPEMLFRWSV